MLPFKVNRYSRWPQYCSALVFASRKRAPVIVRVPKASLVRDPEGGDAFFWGGPTSIRLAVRVFETNPVQAPAPGTMPTDPGLPERPAN